MKKIVYIIPGGGESYLKQFRYIKVAKVFQEAGIEPIHVKIDWNFKKQKRFSDYVKPFLKQYKKPKNTKIYVLGFSFGASIALLAAQKIKPTALILCSLSPYFEEDIKYFDKAWLRWWRKSFIDSDYSFAKLAPKIKIKTYLIVGSKEHKMCLVRARAGKRLIPKSSLTIAKGAKHNIGQLEYLKALEELVLKLQ